MKAIAPIKTPLKGTIRVPGDKSIAHRAVILGSIAKGRTKIFNLSGGDDNSRTVKAFRQLGVPIEREGAALSIEGQGWDGLHAPGQTIDCGNSGTTMRLLSGLLAGCGFHSELDGDSSLRQRPMQRVIDPLSRMGAKISSQTGDGLAPLAIDGGGLRGIEYRMTIASAQVKSAILLAALQARGDTVLQEPQRSRDHTEVMLRGFGAEINAEGRVIRLKGKQQLTGQEVNIPGDISSAAFFLVAATMVPDSDVTIASVGCNPTRDGIVELLQRMGASIERFNQRSEAGEWVADLRVKGSALRGIDVGPEWVARTIDEYPILAVAAARASGKTTFSEIQELRYKESDRITAMSEGLRRLGVKVEEQENSLTVHGARELSGAPVRSFGDHRVAMSLAVAGLVATGDVVIDDAACADISFPTFFELMGQLCLQ